MDAGKKLSMARRYFAPALNQSELATRLGVSRSSVARWETEGTPPTEALLQVASWLGIDPDWFTDGASGEPRFRADVAGNARAVRPAEKERAASSFTRGDQVLLPIWRGVIAGEGECEFWPSDSVEFRVAPAFLASSDPESHVLCIASGLSMAPRIDHAEKAIVKIDPDPPIGAIVIARRPDGANFIKVLRKVDDRRLELHSLNPEFTPISELRDWQLKGYVVAILHTYNGTGANIEWDDGRPLRG